MSKIRDCVYGFAIGDAIGVPIEFEKREKLMRKPVTKMLGFGSYDICEGVWSDDTSMVLATMDSISCNKKIDYDDMASRFCDWINYAKYTATNEVFDIGITTKYALIRFWDSKKDAVKCGGTSFNENGNGSLMRMLPIALYCFYKKLDDNEILKVVKNVSSITHGHDISILGCYIYVRYFMFLLSGKNKYDSYKLLKEINYSMFDKEVVKLYDKILNGDIQEEKIDNIKSTGFVVDTLEAVLWVSLNSDSYNEAIIKAINLGEDTDTIGAITGSIVGLIYGFKEIDKDFINTLKGKEIIDKYIKEYEEVLLTEK